MLICRTRSFIFSLPYRSVISNQFENAHAIYSLVNNLLVFPQKSPYREFIFFRCVRMSLRVLLLVLAIVAPILGIYEDQIGKFDW